MSTFGFLTVVVTVMIGCAPTGATWLDEMTAAAMETAGVKTDDFKEYTDKLHGAIKDVHGAITNAVDKVDKVNWDKLYHIAAENIKPKLKEGLPEEQCVRTLKIRSTTSEILLEEGKVKPMNNMKTVTVKIVGETDTEINVMFKIEYSEIQLEYLFTCTNILQDLYDFETKGRLLIIQKEPVFVAIAASVPKLNTALSQSMRKGECVVKLKSIEAVHEGTLTFDKIKYHHSAVEFTKHTLNRVMNRARKDLKEYIGEGMKFAIETEIRKNNLFCITPEMTQTPLDCKAVTFKKLTL